MKGTGGGGRGDGQIEQKRQKTKNASKINPPTGYGPPVPGELRKLGDTGREELLSDLSAVV